MVTKNNIPTNALYGTVAMLTKLIRDTNPQYMVFCYDREEPSFRKTIYSEYKANRTAPPDDLVPQFAFIRKITEAFGAINLDKKGFEADDIIGSLTHFATTNKMNVVIVSTDKDFAQLVNKKVVLFNSVKNKTYDSEAVIQKWGVSPAQMIDYLALVGDSSDNVPGVRGIGPKGAQKLLLAHKSLDEIYKNINSIEQKSLKKKLQDQKDMAYLSQKLVTIKKDISFNLKVEDLKKKELHKKDLKKIFIELEFKNFEKKLLEEPLDEKKTTEQIVTQKKETKLVEKKISNTKNKFDVKKIKQISCKDLISEIKAYESVWCMVSKNKESVYLYFNKKHHRLHEQSLESIGKILSDKLVLFNGYDIKSIYKDLQIENPRTPEWDQMLASYILRSKNISSLDQIYKEYMPDNKQINISELVESDQINIQIDLKKIIKKKLKDQGSLDILKNLEFPLVPVLYEMERNGIFIDKSILEKQSKDLSIDLKNLEDAIFKESKKEFNIASPKQLSQILFVDMGIASHKKIKTGYSTDRDTLESLKDKYIICKFILDYRECAKLKSTYVDSLPQLINKKTKKIHTDFKQATTTTGRLSSVNPNLQNIPVRTKRGKLIRQAFVATEFCQFISADYSQIELRILAHITKDKNLIQAFEDNQDIHKATASEIFSVSLENITEDQRRTAKAVNFGIAYGQGAYGLAKTLRIDQKEASEIIKRYFKRFKGVQDYMLETIEDAKSRGYVETVFGRKRYIKNINSENMNMVKAAERAAINAPIQGAASDIVKKAMIDVHNSVSAKMILQVHDELIFECKAKYVDEQSADIKKIMESAANLSVDLIVNIHTGSNWQEAH